MVHRLKKAVLGALAVLPVALPATATLPLGSADLVLGQGAFTAAGTVYIASTTLDLGSPVNAAPSYADTVAVDTTSGRLYVVDTGHNRVLFWNASSLASGRGADGVVGQADLYNGGAGTSASRLDAPVAATIDAAGSLWVAEYSNARVLRFPAPVTTGESADLVLGEPDFATSAGGTDAATLGGPVGLRFDPSGNLWVSDNANNRVLRYPAPFSSGMNADLVLGQADFVSSPTGTDAVSLNQPGGLALDASGNLWVADLANSRALRYDAPFTSGMAASLALGQSDPSSVGGLSGAAALSQPDAVAVDGAGNVWVSDADYNRVSRFAPPVTNGEAGSLVLGQADFTGVSARTTADGISSPIGLALDASGDIWVGDGDNNRVLRYPTPLSSGLSADIVLGQAGFTQAARGLDGRAGGGASAVVIDTAHGRAFLAETTEHRVLFWNTLAGLYDGAPADGVLGQTDTKTAGLVSASANSLNTPAALALDGSGNLWVADSVDDRVVRFPAPFSSGMNADIVLGKPTLSGTCASPTAACLGPATGLAFDGGDLWVAGDNRVVRFPAPLSTGMSADLALGQADLTHDLSAASAAGLSGPKGLAFDRAGNLWVADSANNRLVRFAAPFATGEAASVFVGQSGPTTNAAAATASGLSGPSGVAVDGSGSIWAADTTNNRLLRYDPPLTTGMAAFAVIGQTSLTLNAAGTMAAALSAPSAAFVDAAGSLWVADQGNNRALEYLPGSTGQTTSTWEISEGKVFPNPLRPSLGQTAVHFIHLPANATLTIYTLLGEKVRDLTADRAGSAVWDGATRFGNPAASGVYFVLARSGGRHSVYKVAVQR